MASDTTWHVKVSNIGGAGVPAQHSYTVTLIDPDRLNETPLITRNRPLVSGGGNYTVSGVPAADRMEAGFFLRQPASWTEGAEDEPATAAVDGTDASYPLRAGLPGYVKSGSKAFRLTFPTRYDPLINGVAQQKFELGRELVPGPGAQLVFQLRRGLMTSASKLAVEYSRQRRYQLVAARKPDQRDGRRGRSFVPAGGRGSTGGSDATADPIPLPSGRHRFAHLCP